MTPALRAHAERSVQVVTADGRRLSGGVACLFVLQAIEWHPRLAWLGLRPPLVWFVNAGYRIVAGRRDLFAGRFFLDEDASRARSDAAESVDAIPG